MKQSTLCYLIDKNSKKILLGMKKRGFGKGKYNGIGGKVEEGESVEDAVIREVYEEINVKAEKKDVEKISAINFFFTAKNEWNQTVHVFVIKKWSGNPKESEEMKPEWFSFKEIPFDKMWKDDPYWFHLMLTDKKFEADFWFDKDNESIKDFKIR